jgi:hypothetical protein
MLLTLFMVKVNIDFPEDLHRKAKSHASLEGIHLKDFIIDSVRDKLGNL